MGRPYYQDRYGSGTRATLIGVALLAGFSFLNVSFHHAKVSEGCSCFTSLSLYAWACTIFIELHSHFDVNTSRAG